MSDAYPDCFEFTGILKRVRVITDDVAVFDADGEQILNTAIREQ